MRGMTRALNMRIDPQWKPGDLIRDREGIIWLKNEIGNTPTRGWSLVFIFTTLPFGISSINHRLIGPNDDLTITDVEMYQRGPTLIARNGWPVPSTTEIATEIVTNIERQQ